MKKFMFVLLLSSSPKIMAMEESAVQSLVEQTEIPGLVTSVTLSAKANVTAGPELTPPQQTLVETALEKAKRLDIVELLDFVEAETQPAFKAKEKEYNDKKAALETKKAQDLAAAAEKKMGWAVTLHIKSADKVLDTRKKTIEDAYTTALAQLDAEYKAVFDEQKALEEYVHSFVDGATEKAAVDAAQPSWLASTVYRTLADVQSAVTRIFSYTAPTDQGVTEIDLDAAATLTPPVESPNSNNTDAAPVVEEK